MFLTGMCNTGIPSRSAMAKEISDPKQTENTIDRKKCYSYN